MELAKANQARHLGARLKLLKANHTLGLLAVVVVDAILLRRRVDIHTTGRHAHAIAVEPTCTLAVAGRGRGAVEQRRGVTHAARALAG